MTHYIMVLLTKFTVAYSILVTCEAIAQDESADGYVIITSRNTLLGQRVCHMTCQSDSECPDFNRCVLAGNVGHICMPLRTEEAPPHNWRLCESNECALTETCSRKPAPLLIQAFIEHKQSRGFEVYVIDETEWGGGGRRRGG